MLGAPEQDTLTADLFPHLLGNPDPAVRNEAALGVIAGWQVEHTIRRGTFNTLYHHPDTPLARVLAAAVFFPSFRATILSPRTRVLSSAALSNPETSARGLLTVSYDIFEPGDFAAEESAVFAALDVARADVELPPVLRLALPCSHGARTAAPRIASTLRRDVVGLGHSSRGPGEPAHPEPMHVASSSRIGRRLPTNGCSAWA